MNLSLCLDQLEYMQFLRQLHDPSLSFRFKHVLIQETTYASLLIKERSLLHRTVAETLESIFAGELDELAAELAMHHDLAGEAVKAIAYYKSSGERAMRVGAYPEALSAFERALELCPADAIRERANLLVLLAKVYDRHSDLSEAKENYNAALALAQQHDQAMIAATALCGLASVASRQGAHAQAQHLAEQGLTWARQAQDTRTTAQALRQLGIVHNYQGNNEIAVHDLQNALKLYQELNDPEGVAVCLNSLGVVATDRRELESATAFFQQALELAEKLGDRHGMGVRLVNLGVIAQEQGDHAAALHYHEQALALAREIGDREGIAHVDLNLGGILVKQGDAPGAMQHYRAALAETLELGSLALAIHTIAAVAELRVLLRHYQKGAELLGFAFAHPAGTADVKLDFEFLLVRLRAVLSETELKEALQLGETLELEDVANEILSHAD